LPGADGARADERESGLVSRGVLAYPGAAVFQRFARAIAILAAVQLLGGHWAVLQTTAWVKMVVSYSEGDSLAGALEKTFDGAHPCGLCKLVKEGKGEEQKRQLATTVVKLEAVLAALVKVPPPSSVEGRFRLHHERHEGRSVVPVPPPPSVA